MTQPNQPTADELLFSSGPKAFSFDGPIGTKVEGTIVKKDVAQRRDMDSNELLFYLDGNPKNQVVLTLQTSLRDPSIQGDDGLRRWFLSDEAKKQLAKAVRAAGGTSLQVGAHVSGEFIREEKVGNSKFKTKFYKVDYTPKNEVEADVALLSNGNGNGNAAPATVTSTASAPTTAAPAALPDGVTPELLAALAALQKQGAV